MRKGTTFVVPFLKSGTLSHWFMPYKVERGSHLFNVGQKNSRQGNQAQKPKPKPKILEYLQSNRCCNVKTERHDQ